MLAGTAISDVVKMFSNDPEEYRNPIHFLESDKEFEFYVLKCQYDKPIKAVIKGLPSSSKITDITNDLKEIGFKIDSCTQLTSKRTKKSLPYFLVILPRNDFNSKIFDIVKLGYLQVKVEGYLVRGITQCFNCNNFYHTAANCYMKPRCLKCGKEHATRNCHIKERQVNPFCINCQDFGHSTCYTKCPKFPQPKKVTFYHKVHDFTLKKLTAILQSTIVSIADASCTLIGPPLLKSRLPLQAQVSKTKNIRVPDRVFKVYCHKYKRSFNVILKNANIFPIEILGILPDAPYLEDLTDDEETSSVSKTEHQEERHLPNLIELLGTKFSGILKHVRADDSIHSMLLDCSFSHERIQNIELSTRDQASSAM
ncbi:nucleic-acid-binding protein from transposon X-element [Trichonephila clavipes]|nr:nucleic-acid-binding protein from transposon X-element [Trichonephila clavipes]